MPLHAAIAAIDYALPARRLTNAEIARRFPEWGVDKISAKTGIETRHLAAPGETAADLAVAAAERLLARPGLNRHAVDYLIFCTQTPDYFLPASACLIQHRLGLSTACGAIDINQGCSGFVYGLGLAQALITSGQARQVLLITAETYSRHMLPEDKTVQTIFGDAAAATLLVAQSRPSLSHFVYGTDGSGAGSLIVRGGAGRALAGGEAVVAAPHDALWMDGPEVFAFTLRAVPGLVAGILAEAGGMTFADIDLLVMHQANRFMLDALAQRLKCPEEKLLRCYAEMGNTVSSTIPIALAEAQRSGRLKPGMRLLLAGFGVGYSWAGCLVDWVSPFTEEETT